MKLSLGLIRGGLLLTLILITGCGGAMVPDLNDGARHAACISASIQNVLDAMDRDLAITAQRLSITGLESDKARAELRDLCAKHPEVIDCCTVSPEGVMLIVEPSEYAESEGADISAQEQIIRLRESGKPVLSQVFKAVEGFYSVDLEYPVLDDQGKSIGSVSMLIRPELFLDRIITPEMKRHGIECWVMQTDGVILFDQDRVEIGLNLFTNAIFTQFPDLIQTGKRMAAHESGQDSYRFYNAGHLDFVEKECWWRTAGLHGTEWRIAVVQERKR